MSRFAPVRRFRSASRVARRFVPPSEIVPPGIHPSAVPPQPIAPNLSRASSMMTRGRFGQPFDLPQPGEAVCPAGTAFDFDTLLCQPGGIAPTLPGTFPGLPPPPGGIPGQVPPLTPPALPPGFPPQVPPGGTGTGTGSTVIATTELDLLKKQSSQRLMYGLGGAVVGLGVGGLLALAFK